jgi:hypothetical protein
VDKAAAKSVALVFKEGPRAELWGLTDQELQEIQRSLAELG